MPQSSIGTLSNNGDALHKVFVDKVGWLSRLGSCFTRYHTQKMIRFTVNATKGFKNYRDKLDSISSTSSCMFGVFAGLHGINGSCCFLCGRGKDGRTKRTSNCNVDCCGPSSERWDKDITRTLILVGKCTSSYIIDVSLVSRNS